MYYVQTDEKSKIINCLYTHLSKDINQVLHEHNLKTSIQIRKNLEHGISFPSILPFISCDHKNKVENSSHNHATLQDLLMQWKNI